MHRDSLLYLVVVVLHTIVLDWLTDKYYYLEKKTHEIFAKFCSFIPQIVTSKLPIMMLSGFSMVYVICDSNLYDRDTVITVV